MKILHVSDLHLGKTLQGRSRIQEQTLALARIIEIARERAVDLALIAGDIFDTFNPSAEAEEIFYEFLAEMSEQGKRGIIAIAGNHDNPERIEASNPIAARHGISLVGGGLTNLGLGGSDDRARRVASGEGWLEITVPGCPHSAIVATLGYPSEKRLGKLFCGNSKDFASESDRIETTISECLKTSAGNFRPGSVNIVLAHLLLQGGRGSGEERTLPIGGIDGISARVIPPGTDLVALGHLHRPQEVKEASVASHYSGSILPYLFAESDRRKTAIVYEVEPGKSPHVDYVDLNAGFSLVTWLPKDIVEAVSWARDESRDPNSWLEIRIQTPGYFSQSELETIRNTRGEKIVNIITENPRPVPFLDAGSIVDGSDSDVFKSFRQFLEMNEASPVEELSTLFGQILDEVSEEGEKSEVLSDSPNRTREISAKKSL